MSKYTVFCDGVEMNSYYLTLEQAKDFHADCITDGYDPYVHKVVFNKNGEVKEYKYVPLVTDKEYAL